MLEVKNLSVSIHDKPILDGLNLSVKAGQIAAIMGPNGSGKSTLSYVIAGKPDYEVTGGEVLLDGENLLELEPDARAAKGVFLAFQYPVEIPGVATMTFLKASLNAQRRARGEGDLTTPDFMRMVRGAAAGLKIDPEMLKRPVNVGFSGGEKKRLEILQMAVLRPRLCVLDETDSGLDIDALRIVSDGVNALRDAGRSFVIITHYQRLLDYIKPDVVHVMANGRIAKSGGPELALELERNGYGEYSEAAACSAPLTRIKSSGETMLDLQFAALATRDADRIAAFQSFAKKGLPTRRDEAWHYTDLRAAMREAQTPAPAPDEARITAAREALGARASWAAARFVLVDGCFVEELSDPAPAGALRGAITGWPADYVADPVVQLNVAFAPRRGLLVNVAEGAQIERPVEIVHYASDGGAVYSHVSVALLPGASATILETFIGAKPPCQRNALAFVTLGAGARLDLVTEVTDRAAIHVETQEVSLGREAAFRAFGLVDGGDLVRRQIFARHAEPGAKISLSGLSLLDGKRHADTTLTVRHEAPHGESREYFRHIVADEATGVYQGKVIVAPHAQKTDGGMKSQALLLSPTAQMNNKPELEIFADDVVCGHGATVGALDAEQIFYLRARGISKAEAEAMLLEAFGAEAIERVADEQIAERVREQLRAWLKGRGAA